ncbi:MAG: hypothetical protein PUK67_10330, partial [Prevotellaceae bacterium]|nr:hypothetical protein [Prevotellaceae bacterium]MDY3365057.1 hypothetical protein [Prevotella sp.]
CKSTQKNVDNLWTKLVNTIWTKRGNRIVPKGDYFAWPKGSKLHGFSTCKGTDEQVFLSDAEK